MSSPLMPPHWWFPVTALLMLAGPLAACPLGLPSDMKGVTVSESLQINGLPTAIQEVDSIEPAERVIRQTELEWKSQGFFPERNRRAPWLMVSAASKDCVTVLQLKEGENAHGFFSVSRPQDTVPPLDDETRRLLPMDSRVESVVQGKDQGRNGVTIVLRADKASAGWTDDLMRQLAQSKWQNLDRHLYKQPTRNTAAERVTARLDRRLFTAIVWGANQTQAVITVTDPL